MTELRAVSETINAGKSTIPVQFWKACALTLLCTQLLMLVFYYVSPMNGSQGGGPEKLTAAVDRVVHSPVKSRRLSANTTATVTVQSAVVNKGSGVQVPGCLCEGSRMPSSAGAVEVTKASASVPLLQFPEGIKSVIINIGSNSDPPMPSEADPSEAVIAVEPILKTAVLIKNHQRLFVILAAISDGVARFQTMQVHNTHGVSSSLAKPSDQALYWVGTKNDGWPPFQIVPVMTMKSLLDSVPKHIKIKHLKTDMQGFDFAAVSSAGRSIRRIPSLFCEVYANTNTYQGVKNDLFRDWDPYMKSIGYQRISADVQNGLEGDAQWKRIGEEEL